MANNEPNEVGERGVMINTASIAAFEGQIGQGPTRRQRQVSPAPTSPWPDLGTIGVRVMTIAPSLFATAHRGHSSEAELQLTKDAAFPKRMGRPHEFATMIAICESPMMNGSTLRVDGGQRFAPR